MNEILSLIEESKVLASLCAALIIAWGTFKILEPKKARLAIVLKNKEEMKTLLSQVITKLKIYTSLSLAKISDEMEKDNSFWTHIDNFSHRFIDNKKYASLFNEIRGLLVSFTVRTRFSKGALINAEEFWDELNNFGSIKQTINRIERQSKRIKI